MGSVMVIHAAWLGDKHKAYSAARDYAIRTGKGVLAEMTNTVDGKPMYLACAAGHYRFSTELNQEETSDGRYMRPRMKVLSTITMRPHVTGWKP